MKIKFIITILMFSGCTLLKNKNVPKTDCQYLGTVRKVEFLDSDEFKFISFQLGAFDFSLEVNNCIKKNDSCTIIGRVFSFNSELSPNNVVIAGNKSGNNSIDTLTLTDSLGTFSITYKINHYDYLFIFQRDKTALCYTLNDFGNVSD